jgi:hypothetical protein
MWGGVGSDFLAVIGKLGALQTPHPTSLREATFSHKGRRQEPGFGGSANR